MLQVPCLWVFYQTRHVLLDSSFYTLHLPSLRIYSWNLSWNTRLPWFYGCFSNTSNSSCILKNDDFLRLLSTLDLLPQQYSNPHGNLLVPNKTNLISSWVSLSFIRSSLLRYLDVYTLIFFCDSDILVRISRISF